MNPPSSPLSLLIAAQDAHQCTALSDMLRSIRPGLQTVEFGSEPGREAPSMAMIVEPVGPVSHGSRAFGELSTEVRARHPEISIIVIAARFDERAIAALAAVAVAAIVPSPCEPSALLRVLTEVERKASFVGRVNAIETGELLRLLAAAQSNGVLHFAGGDGRDGAVHLENGQPVNAHVDELVGGDAVAELLRWRDAKVTWIRGRSASARTILGRVEGLLDNEPANHPAAAAASLGDAPREVLKKIERLAATPDILAAYLMRDSEIVAGQSTADLDESVVTRALCRLSHVYHDMEGQQGDGAGTEIQATVGDHRLVVDRLGPTRLGFQIGVVVRQATPVCKSLRRLLRQIDRSFRRSLARGHTATAAEHSPSATLHRVA